MKFLDEALITVTSGNGGNGCLSFRREKFIPKGGPDGGDGGKGGDVILKATSRKRTLFHFRYKKSFIAPNGRHGEGNQRTGKSGHDLVIEVPPGTIVTDQKTGELLVDLVENDQTYTVAEGGRGGKGNKHFASSTHRTPRFSQPGQPGQIKSLKLELKLLADIGIIGFPNAGKSTLISVLSAARPKIADYPFTTLTPSLGVVKTDFGEPFVIADIPGLIEGAHQGTGLGTRFLKHVERTNILLHLIDVSTIDPEDPLAGYHQINKELELYDNTLIQKKQVIVLNKMDLSESEKLADIFCRALANKKILRISAVTQSGINALTKELFTLLENPDA